MDENIFVQESKSVTFMNVLEQILEEVRSTCNLKIDATFEFLQ